MDLERHAYYKKAACKEYAFYSEGPGGRIRKIVRFRLTMECGIVCYNLSFGDWNERLGNINYNIASNVFISQKKTDVSQPGCLATLCL